MATLGMEQGDMACRVDTLECPRCTGLEWMMFSHHGTLVNLSGICLRNTERSWRLARLSDVTDADAVQSDIV